METNGTISLSLSTNKAPADIVIPKRVIRTRFLDVKDNLDLVIYSLFRSTDSGLVDELYLRIKEDGGDFTDLAHHSDGPESQSNCIVGPCPITKAHPAIAIKLKSLPPGVVKPPFLFSKWSVLLRVEKRIPACFRDWEKTIEEVLLQEMSSNDQAS